MGRSRGSMTSRPLALAVADQEQVADLAVDEVLVASQVIFVDVQARSRPEETFEVRPPVDVPNSWEELALLSWARIFSKAAS